MERQGYNIKRTKTYKDAKKRFLKRVGALADERRRSGRTQQEMADDIGVSLRTIAYFETGESFNGIILEAYYKILYP